MATAVLGVGVPVLLMAVTATVSWKIVWSSLVPKNRVPVVPLATGAAPPKYCGDAVVTAVTHVFVFTAVPMTA